MASLMLLGYGSQCRAWAANLKDNGSPFHILLRPDSSSINKVKQDGHKLNLIKKDKLPDDLHLALLIPDHLHLQFLEEFKEILPDKTHFVLAHGFSFVSEKLAEKFKDKNWTYSLLAPKAIASELRKNYIEKKPSAGVYSLENLSLEKKEKTHKWLINLAHAIGIKVGPFEVTFEQETHADLFSEQSLLCSILPYASLMSYNTLRKNNIPKELAYLECWYEVKLIADTMIELGPEKFFKLISPNALIGGDLAKEEIFGTKIQKIFDELYKKITNGDFVKTMSKIDVDLQRSKIEQFWKNEELSFTHKELATKLFPTEQR